MINLHPAFRVNFLIILALSGLCLFPSFAMGHDLNKLDKKPLTVDFNDVVKGKSSQPGDNQRPTLKIAVAAMISPSYTYKYYVELLNWIGERMGRDVVFVQRKTYSEVNKMLKQNELDLAFVCSGPYVSGKSAFGAEIIAVPVCHGEKVYYSYFIAHKESRIKSFQDYRGKTFAFTDPMSNTGFMVPRFYLAKLAETPEQYFKKTFFTHSHDNSIQAVADGLADGAAVDSLIYEFIRAKNPGLTQKTKIVEKSPPYGIPPVVTTPAMNPDTKAKLKNIFFSVHEDTKGKKLLETLQIERFVEGDDKDYDTVRELQNFIKCRHD
jgi:phosphonate transport system substrate-binding protein